MDDQSDEYRVSPWYDQSPAPEEPSDPPGATWRTCSRVHRALKTELQEFRVVILLPSNDLSSTIECQLVHTSLNGNQSYEALSYVWGEPACTKRILLDNEPFYITPNLEIALMHLRYPNQERTLWVDAICINQSDVDERNEQVRQMRDIYSHCAVNIFWLGVHSDLIERGMQIVEDLEGIDITKLQVPADGREEHERAAWMLTRADWEALGHLFSRPPIWRRVWVMQEISCAPAVMLVAGKSVMEWELVERLLGSKDHYMDAFHSAFSHGTSTMTSEIFADAQIVNNQRKIFREMQEGGESFLLDVLARFRSTLSTDPRDKIYALLGLVSDTLGIEVDYHKSVKDVFINVVECIINSCTNLDIICQTQWAMFGHPKRNQDLPSWVPDFACLGPGDFLFAQRSIFCAGDQTCRTPCKISKTGLLNVECTSLGRITRILGTSLTVLHQQPGNEHKSHIQKLWILMMDWMRNYLDPEEQPHRGGSSTYTTGEPTFKAFWRTWVADCKAYPMRRLDASDIEHDDSIFRKICEDASLSGMVRDLRCYTMLKKMMWGWRFATLHTGFYAMVRIDAQEGDEVVAVHGAKVPFTLRHVQGQDENVFRVIGGGYVHGFMDGQARLFAQDGRLRSQNLHLA